MVSEETPDFRGDFEQLLAYALPRGNDLEAPAARLVPEISEVLAALLALDGRAPCAALGQRADLLCAVRQRGRSRTRGRQLAAEFPNWWVAASSLGS